VCVCVEGKRGRGKDGEKEEETERKRRDEREMAETLSPRVALSQSGLRFFACYVVCVCEGESASIMTAHWKQGQPDFASLPVGAKTGIVKVQVLGLHLHVPLWTRVQA
jgi:hypothetical protein